MRRDEFEHVIRAAAAVVEDEIVVVGSQAVLANHQSPPETLLQSREVDVFPRTDPERADEIDGAIGDGSQFHATFGYYAHGVGPETVIGPAGWQERLVRFEVAPFRQKDGPVIAWSVEVHDLVLAKLAAGRTHDLVFAAEAIAAALVDRDQLRLGLDLMPASHRDFVAERLEGLLSNVDRETQPQRPNVQPR
jgi:hypothetical protein